MWIDEKFALPNPFCKLVELKHLEDVGITF